ncbi:MAG: tetratricopeptide repeat protein [Ferruginibacter sp.]
MKKTSSFILALLLFPCTGVSQTKYQLQTDSLKLELAKAKADSTQIKLLLDLLSIYALYKPEEGIGYKDTALKIAAKTNKRINVGRVNDKIGRLYWSMGKFSDAYKYHFTALDIYNETGDKYARNYVLVEIGQDYLNDTKFDEAGKYLLLSLKLSKETDDKQNMFRTYDKLIALFENLGNFAEASKATYANLKICEELGDNSLLSYAQSAVAATLQTQGSYTEALKYYNKSLQLALALKDEQTLTATYRSIGDIYTITGNYEEAEKNYQAGIAVAQKMENPVGTLNFLYRGIGNMYRAEKRYPEALDYLLKSAEELRSIASNHALASQYSEIGIVYTHMNNYKLARNYFDSSMALCKKLNTTINFESYYSGLHLLDSATGNWKAAYEHYKQYVSVKDSSFNKETLRKMVISQMQYEHEKEEAIVKAVQEKKDLLTLGEIKRQRNIRNAAFAVLAVALLFSVVVYRQRNKIAKEKKRSDLLLSDKELLLKEIHHRVKNNLEVVSSLLALQSAQIDDPNTKEVMLAGQNRVQSIGIVHQKLYQGANLGAIEMKDYFIDLSESILDSFGAEKRVTIECAMDQLDVDIDTAVPIGLIVNELLTNTLKYAFPEGQPGKVQIKLQKQTDGSLHLEVSDNGVGKSGVTHGTGFGGQLVSLLTRQLNGSVREEIKEGTHIYFEFKSTKAA